ncbi:hypothetical protein [Nitrolancea hollandica]|uniref:Uncharacterized protein n=1 Tax=Nitrolancea hollandica Lb TaxID=1129897 RepID=I4ELL5_9BACT|nr:hypothetical protein [Nitrolancea hollandica]CCF85577.1 hypothetical protein NITHO_5160021 [Nitrolancea hollandica Lb]
MPEKLATTNTLTCRVCGAELMLPRTGRPPRYCTVTCRRAAEYALKRTNRHLEGLEWRRDCLRRRLTTEKLYAACRRAIEKEIAVLEADIDHYRAELGRLLAD